MFTKEELKAINTKYWTAFGNLMKPHKSAQGSKVNWSNYNTKVKGLYFRLLADKKSASVCFDFENKDADIKELQLAQFEELKTVFNNIMPCSYSFEQVIIDDRFIDRFSVTINNCSLYNESSWPDMFAFYKTHVIAFDEFWTNFKELFLELK